MKRKRQGDHYNRAKNWRFSMRTLPIQSRNFGQWVVCQLLGKVCEVNAGETRGCERESGEYHRKIELAKEITDINYG